MNTLTTWNPLRELEEMQDRVLRALKLGAGNREPAGQQQSLAMAQWLPAVDISEDDAEYLIKAELPEVNKEDVKITVENGVVSIRGERKFESEEKNKKYHRVERSYGSFLRSFGIPADADPSAIQAEFKEGVLLVRLPKCEEKKPKQIEVKVA